MEATIKHCMCQGGIDCEASTGGPFITLGGKCDCQFYDEHFFNTYKDKLPEKFHDWMDRGNYDLTCSIRHTFNFRNVKKVDQKEWGILRKLFFTVRVIYHVCMGFFLDYGIWIIRGLRFIDLNTRNDLRRHNVGERFTRLFLEYHDIEYNPLDYPLKTIETRLWNWILRR